MNPIKKRIVIIGGGFGGIAAAKKIFASKKTRRIFDVILVEKKDYQLFFPSLFKAVSSSESPTKIFSVCAVKLADIFKNQNLEIIPQEADSISFEGNYILAKEKGSVRKKITYDYLVVAPGSAPRVSGLALLSFDSAMRIRSEIEAIFKAKAKREKVKIAILGAGLTGCELAGFLKDFCEKMSKMYGHPKQMARILIVEASGGILGFLPSRQQNSAREFLEKNGVEFILNRKADDEFLKDEKPDIVIWAGGGTPLRLGEYEIGPDLLVKGAKNVFSIEAKSAQDAIAQGKHIAEEILSLEKGNSVKLYMAAKSLYVVDLGRKFSSFMIGPFVLKGFLSKFFHLAGFFLYFWKTVSFFYAIDWLKAYNKL
ncbi:MAG: FAD-dependent oxidoreductase [Candidatus Pacebacteria bacterium]|nr:FAD-dependent oxidoreductase [Candidatus Paceibacterota bacterium]